MLGAQSWEFLMPLYQAAMAVTYNLIVNFLASLFLHLTPCRDSRVCKDYSAKGEGVT